MSLSTFWGVLNLIFPSTCGFGPQIRLKEIFETETDIALILELVTGGELFDRCLRPKYTTLTTPSQPHIPAEIGFTSAGPEVESVASLSPPVPFACFVISSNL